MKEQRKKFLIRFLICLFGIYILITNMFVAIICTVLLMRNNIAVTEYVLSIIYVCLTSFAYYKVATYFLYQKIYKMVETPEQQKGGYCYIFMQKYSKISKNQVFNDS